jgi:hypothetical protein
VDKEDIGGGPPHDLLLANKKLDITISISNFQGYWQGSDKSVSSSYSLLHMCHFKAASVSKELLALHTAKLTACVAKKEFCFLGGVLASRFY